MSPSDPSPSQTISANKPSATGRQHSNKNPQSPTSSAGTTSKNTPTRRVEDDFIVQAPTLSVPKGGGAIRSIGETAEVSHFSGSASINAPIYVTPSRGGFQPNLNLAYSSGAGNGPFGMGWNIGLGAVSRKTAKKLPEYKDDIESDIFILGAEDLVPKMDDMGDIILFDYSLVVTGQKYKITRYLPRIEAEFSVIEHWVNTQENSNDRFWKTISQANITTYYGRTVDARIEHPTKGTYSWLIEEQYDGNGNAIKYVYKKENDENINQEVFERNRPNPNQQQYIKRIFYGNTRPCPNNEITLQDGDWHFQVVFDYGEHQADAGIQNEAKQWDYRKADASSSFKCGFDLRTKRYCQRVLMLHKIPNWPKAQAGDWTMVASTDIGYTTYSKQQPYKQIKTIEKNGYTCTHKNTYRAKSLPKLQFTYTHATPASQAYTLDKSSLTGLPAGLANTRHQYIDWFSESTPGLLIEGNFGLRYKPATGIDDDGKPTFGKPIPLPEVPNLGPITDPSNQLQVISPSGRLAMVRYRRPNSGYTEQEVVTQDELQVLDKPKLKSWAAQFSEELVPIWGKLQRLQKIPNIDLSSPQLRMLDLNGDGMQDILIADVKQLIWYPSKAEEGFGNPITIAKLDDDQEQAKLMFSAQNRSLYLADMTGDGLQDIVQIERQKISYYPNMGFGHFGSIVTMAFEADELATHVDFTRNRLHLVDADGSGTMDIIYLGKQSLYFKNIAGNTLQAPDVLDGMPAIDNMQSVQVIDLLANGTLCITWSSPLIKDSESALKYYPLMNSGKPYLLQNVDNNLGSKTEYQYKPSSVDYLDDKYKNQSSWKTRLPFVVQVVKKVIIHDLINDNHYSQSFHYKHGFYDSHEKSFNGFGYVEQTDIDDWQGDALDQAPVLTKRWYHTGADCKHGTLEHHYRSKEYFNNDPDAWHLPEFTPDNTWSDEHKREAYRAIKGQLLREEVYAQDKPLDPILTEYPFTVVESNSQAYLVQPAMGERQAVFSVRPQQTLSYHYERLVDDSELKQGLRLQEKPEKLDPRITQTYSLEFDVYNNVTLSASIAYSKRQTHPGDAPQNLAKITFAKTKFAHRDLSPSDYANALTRSEAGHRLSVPVHQMAYELFNTDYRQHSHLTLVQCQTMWDAQQLNGLRFSSRLLSEVRHQFWSDDLAGLSALGESGNHGIGFRALTKTSRQRALETSHLQLYPEPVTALLAANGYESIDGAWWIKSGDTVYDKTNYFQVQSVLDPFGQQATLTYQQNGLMLQQTMDPLGNITKVEAIDWRTLQAQHVVGPNGNWQKVRFDALGHTEVYAIGGSEQGRQSGDELDLNDPEFTEDDINTCLEQPLKGNEDEPNPKLIDLLKQATGMVIVDLRPFDTKKPKPVAMLAVNRTLHHRVWGQRSTTEQQDSKQLQISMAYQDGLGRELGAKTWVDSGEKATGTYAKQRWLASGLVAYNNKANPIKSWEPFFSFDHHYEVNAVGAYTTQQYDALDRVIKVTHPDNSSETTAFTPWLQVAWDRNSNSEEGDWLANITAVNYPTSNQDIRRLVKSETKKHIDKPTVSFLDVLGRPYKVEEWDRDINNDSPKSLKTTTELDIIGNPLSIQDPRFIKVIQSHFDLLGQAIVNNSVDSGRRLVLHDAAGQAIKQWDAKKQKLTFHYDALRRPIKIVQQLAGRSSQQLLQGYFYGETLDDAAANNLRGQLLLQFDQAGIQRFSQFDFKGAPKITRRYWQVGDNADLSAIAKKDWHAELNGQDTEGLLTWLDNSADYKEYAETETKLDALDRPVEQTYRVHLKNSDGSPGYNTHTVGKQKQAFTRMGGIKNSHLTDYDRDEAVIVKSMKYNARGQVKKLVRGNNVTTEYTYNKQSYRLERLLSTAGDGSGIKTLQDIKYHYDANGNIVVRVDDAQPTEFFGNAQVQSKFAYQYDGFDRLTYAEGREFKGNAFPHIQDAKVLGDSSSPNDKTPSIYERHYEYDDGGNMQSVRSRNGTTQHFEMEPTSNRLQRSYWGQNNNSVDYDPNGNMTRMQTQSLELEWDVFDQLTTVNRSPSSANNPQMTYHSFDAAGQRVQKIDKDNSRIRQRLYFGPFEIYREYPAGLDSNVKTECFTLHGFNGDQRLLMVDRFIRKDNSVSTDKKLRYQLNDHLNSSSMELDENRNLLAYEEFYPYGASAYSQLKGIIKDDRRYRFTGKERDSSGLDYFGARFLVSGLARWCSADPAGFVDGVNVFGYVSNNPMNTVDPNGMAGLPSRIQLEGAGYETAHRGADTARGGIVTVGTGHRVFDFSDQHGEVTSIKISAKEPEPNKPENESEFHENTSNQLEDQTRPRDSTIDEAIKYGRKIAGVARTLVEKIVRGNVAKEVLPALKKAGIPAIETAKILWKASGEALKGFGKVAGERGLKLIKPKSLEIAKKAIEGSKYSRTLNRTAGRALTNQVAKGVAKGVARAAGSSLARGAARILPGLNIAVAAADTVKAIVILADPEASVAKKFYGMITSGLSIAAATNVPLVSSLAGLLSIGTAILRDRPQPQLNPLYPAIS